MKMYFKMTNQVYPDQWMTAELDVTPGFSPEEFCKKYDAVEITRKELNRLNGIFEKTRRIPKEEAN